MKKILVLIALLLASFVQAQDYNSYLAEATKAFDNGMYRKAYDSSTKAIALNDSNIDARWLRVKSSLTANAPKERLETAIADLKFIAQSKPSGKVYKTLGIAESELANFIYRFNRTVVGYQNDAILHYENSNLAYKKAVELSPELYSDLKFDIKNTEVKVAEIKASKT